MFDIGWSELVVIGIVALIAIGPKELPTVLRALGHWTGKLRRMASEFQGQFQEAMREAEIADLKKQFDEASNAASSVTNFDPVATTRKELESTYEKALETPKDALVETAPTGPSNGPAAAPPEPAVDAAIADLALPPPAAPEPVNLTDIAPAPGEPGPSAPEAVAVEKRA